MKNWFEESTYEINGQVYSVPKLSEWAAKNLRVVQLPVKEIEAKYVWAEKLFIDLPDDDEWSRRSMGANLSYPILMLRYKQGSLEIIDGNHRTWKAWKTKQPAVPAYIIDAETLPPPNQI